MLLYILVVSIFYLREGRASDFLIIIEQSKKDNVLIKKTGRLIRLYACHYYPRKILFLKMDWAGVPVERVLFCACHMYFYKCDILDMYYSCLFYKWTSHNFLPPFNPHGNYGNYKKQI